MTKEEEKYTTLDIDQVKWWVNHLFNMAKEQACNSHNFDDGEEIQSAQDKIIKLLEQQPSDDKVSMEVYKQVMSERDIAIEQLHELGYSFGEKIKTSDDCVSRAEVNKLYDEYRPRLATHVSEFGDKLKSLPPVTPFPKGATNGDMIKAMFPDIKIHEHEKTDICDAYIQIDIWDFSICVSKDWWNAPYKRGNEDEVN